MKKYSLILIALLGALACKALTPNPQEVETPVATDEPPSVIVQITDAPTEETAVTSSTGFTIVRLKPEDGDLAAMLASESKKAQALGQMPVVEFDATWCPPCQAIDQSIGEENELMMNAYDETYIIKLDVDVWGWDNGKVEMFQFEAIPVYFKLDTSGKPNGEVIDGGAWGEDIPENIAPVMDAFFHIK